MSQTLIPRNSILIDADIPQFGPQLAPEHRSRAHFMKVGVGSEDKHDAKPPFYTLKSLMDHNGHDYMFVPLFPSCPTLFPHMTDSPAATSSRSTSKAPNTPPSNGS